MKIKTDNKWHDFKYRHEVPEYILGGEFDWLDTGVMDGFILYKRVWYHLDEFVRADQNSPFYPDWDGYHSDSYFSGILIKLSDDGEQYKIGTYMS